MARKYKFHRWYTVMWMETKEEGKHAKDGLTLREARGLASELYAKGAYRVDIVKRLSSQNRADGVVKLEEI